MTARQTIQIDVRATRRQRAARIVRRALATAACATALAPAGPANGAEVAREDPAGAAPTASASIIGGYLPAPSQWPWMAAILDRQAGTTDYQRQRCGGALVHPRLVVSAAHCFPHRDARRLQVVLGKRRLSAAGGEHIQVSRLVIHPSYDRPELSHDVALLYLERPSAMTPATLLERNVTLYQGNLVTVMGWGLPAMRNGYDYAREHADDLTALDQVIWGDDTCRRAGQTAADAAWYSSAYHPATAICAGDSGSYRATCKGDSGSPMMVRNTLGQWRLVGVVSWGGLACSGAASPTVYSWLHGATLRAFVENGVREAGALGGAPAGGVGPEAVTRRPAISIRNVRLRSVAVRRGRKLEIRLRSSAAGVARLVVRRKGRALSAWTASVRRGANRILLPTRVGRRKLARSSYRLTVNVTSGGRRSGTAWLGFRIR